MAEETACIHETSCTRPLLTLYELPRTASLPKPESSTKPPVDLVNEMVATTNGSLVLKLKPGPEFPQYGGTLAVKLPSWYFGSDAASVFSINPKTICSAPRDVLTVETQLTANLVHTLIYSEYTPGKEIVLTCSNYRNPIQAGTISGFEMSLSDRETPYNLIARYPEWSFTIPKLEPRELRSQLSFALFVNGSDEPTQDPVSIQTKVGLSIEFGMGAIPVDSRECYVKYSFPYDVPLPEDGLGYLSSSEEGKQMMLS